MKDEIGSILSDISPYVASGLLPQDGILRWAFGYMDMVEEKIFTIEIEDAIRTKVPTDER